MTVDAAITSVADELEKEFDARKGLYEKLRSSGRFNVKELHDCLATEKQHLHVFGSSVKTAEDAKTFLDKLRRCLLLQLRWCLYAENAVRDTDLKTLIDSYKLAIQALRQKLLAYGDQLTESLSFAK